MTTLQPHASVVFSCASCALCASENHVLIILNRSDGHMFVCLIAKFYSIILHRMHILHNFDYAKMPILSALSKGVQVVHAQNVFFYIIVLGKTYICLSYLIYKNIIIYIMCMHNCTIVKLEATNTLKNQYLSAFSLVKFFVRSVRVVQGVQDGRKSMKELETQYYIDKATGVFWNELNGLTTDAIYREYESICADHEIVPESKIKVTKYVQNELNLKCEMMRTTAFKSVKKNTIGTIEQIEKAIKEFPQGLEDVSTFDFYNEYVRMCLLDDVEPIDKRDVVKYVCQTNGFHCVDKKIYIYRNS